MREAELRALLARGALSGAQSRPELADLRAQVAANEKGVQELLRMVAHFGLDVVQRLHAATCRTTPRRACGA